MNRELCIMKHGMFVIKNPSTSLIVEGFFYSAPIVIMMSAVRSFEI
jgi:hypothetical protein